MEDQKTDNSDVVKLTDGRSVQLKCPICQSNEFGSARPSASQPGAGFQHVTAGRELINGKPGDIMVLPAKFKYCLNCGFIMKFVLHHNQKGEGE